MILCPGLGQNGLPKFEISQSQKDKYNTICFLSFLEVRGKYNIAKQNKQVMKVKGGTIGKWKRKGRGGTIGLHGMNLYYRT
jgi:hypothetical protein